MKKNKKINNKIMGKRKKKKKKERKRGEQDENNHQGGTCTPYQRGRECEGNTGRLILTFLFLSFPFLVCGQV